MTFCGIPLTLALSHGGERGAFGVGRVWRASPAKFASLFRVPFAMRKGRVS